MNSAESSSTRTADEKLCFALIGHSGTGKSTLIESCLSAKNWPEPWKPRLLRKCTTRALRSSEEAKELVVMERNIFLEKQAEGSLVTVYENHGELYGMEKSEVVLQAPDEFSLVSLNTQAAIALKESTILKVYVCLVEADQQVRQQRLLARGDAGTLQQLESRLEHQENPLRNAVADFVLSANGPVEEVCFSLRKYIESVLSLFPRTHG